MNKILGLALHLLPFGVLEWMLVEEVLGELVDHHTMDGPTCHLDLEDRRR